MRSDDEIKRAVEEELRWTPEIDDTNIAVAVKDGVVTLKGFVRDYTHTWMAEEAVKRVAGVVGVANDLEVRFLGTDPKPDPDIARDAIAAIRFHAPDIADRIRVTVHDGWVTLEGDVESNHLRKRAEDAVRSARGLRGIINAIEVKPKAEPVEVKRRIEEALRRNALIDAERIKVKADGREVILEGEVRSWAERKEAERVAWSAPGVAKVENRIVVSP